MLNINTQSLPEQQDNEFKPFKAQVPVLIERFQVDTDSKHGLQFLSMKMQVLDGEYKGRILFDDFKGLIDGTSEAWNNALTFNVTEASGAKIRTLLEAVGLSQLTDPSQLNNKTAIADAYVNKKGYQAIGKYLPIGEQTQQPQQTQQPVQQAQTNPFASGNSTPQANPFAPR